MLWGHIRGSVDFEAAASELRGGLRRGVLHLRSTVGAFAALTGDGAVITWGRADTGGDSSGCDLRAGVLEARPQSM